MLLLVLLCHPESVPIIGDMHEVRERERERQSGCSFCGMPPPPMPLHASRQRSGTLCRGFERDGIFSGSSLGRMVVSAELGLI